MKKIVKQQGYTLIEVLVALTLALFLSSVLIEIFIQCKKTYYLTEHLNNIQTSARIAFNSLSRDIRMAGLIGCVRLRDFFPLNTQLTPDTRLVVWQQGFSAINKNLPYFPLAKSDSDIILIEFLDPDTQFVKFAHGRNIALVGKSAFHFKDKCLISDCRHAEAFQWGQFNFKHTYQRDSEVGFLNKIVYYIGNTGRRSHKGNTIFALYRRNLNKSANNPIELVEGIEKMSVRLGVTNEKGGPLLYLHSHQLKKGFKVRAVEITLFLQDKKSLMSEWKHIIALRE